MEIELLNFTRQNLFLLILMKSIRIDMRTNLLFLFLFFWKFMLCSGGGAREFFDGYFVGNLTKLLLIVVWGPKRKLVARCSTFFEGFWGIFKLF
jgi:hypothetical protein